MSDFDIESDNGALIEISYFYHDSGSLSCTTLKPLMMMNSVFTQKRVVGFKLLVIIILMTLSPYMLVNAQTNVILTIDYSITSPEPDANMKRGYVLRDAIVLKNNNVLADLDSIAALNCEIVNLSRDLNQFNPNYDPQLKNYYKSYRSNTNTQYFGADGEFEEFRKVNGSLVVSVNSNFIDICNRAEADSLQMIIQASGTPVKGNTNGSVTQMFNLDTTREFQNSARFYAFPASSDYNAVADAVVSWMSIIKSNTGAGNIIWAGHQEPSHTAGYPNGIQTTSGTESNVKAYVDVWKPIATNIKNQNLGKIAGIQLNEEYADYSVALNNIASKNVPIDYFSIQNYKGENNQPVINTAVQNLDSNGLGSIKILLDRYDFDAGFSSVEDRYNSSAGMTQFLKNELVLLNHADKIYGYCLFTGALHQNMMDETMKFLNTMPVRRRDIAGIGQGINAWCTANGNDFYMALWNSAIGDRSVTINLKKFPLAYNTFKMNIRKASDTSLSNYGNATWTPGTAGIIDNIILEQNTFVLIQLNASGTAAKVASNQPNGMKTEEILTYPNPVNNMLSFTIPQDASYSDLQLVNIAGQILRVYKAESLQPGLNDLNVTGLPKGIYIMKITINNNPIMKRIVVE